MSLIGSHPTISEAMDYPIVLPCPHLIKTIYPYLIGASHSPSSLALNSQVCAITLKNVLCFAKSFCHALEFFL